MTEKAYLVVIIDTHSLCAVSAGIFSEPTPTMAFHFTALTAAEAEGASFAEAKKILLEWIGGNPWIQWVRRLPSRDWMPDPS